jgi:glycosyltransferase family protein
VRWYQRAVYWLGLLRWRNPSVCSNQETLDLLSSGSDSLSRFGDGELRCVMGEDICFQKADPRLTARLREILGSDEPGLLVGLPEYLHGPVNYTEARRRDWAAFHREYRHLWLRYLRKGRRYVSASVTRPYMARTGKSDCGPFFEQWKRLWQDQDLVVIEGEQSRLGLRNDFFAPARSVRRILCPPSDAFDAYDAILAAAAGMEKTALLLIALGPAATVLACDLHRLGFRALDVGSIDIEYDWFRTGAVAWDPVPGKYIHDAGEAGTIVGPADDPAYEAQIIARISRREG